MKINTLRRPLVREVWLPYVIVTVAFLATRLGMVIWRLADPVRWHMASRGVTVLPVLGVIILPWTTMALIISGASGSITGNAWVWVGVAVLFDLLMYDRGVWGRPPARSTN